MIELKLIIKEDENNLGTSVTGDRIFSGPPNFIELLALSNLLSDDGCKQLLDISKEEIIQMGKDAGAMSVIINGEEDLEKIKDTIPPEIFEAVKQKIAEINKRAKAAIIMEVLKETEPSGNA